MSIPRRKSGPDCEIGPYCVIGEHVVLGAGCKLHAHVVVDGHTKLGRGNEIFPFASLGLKTQDLKWKGGVTRTEIGDHNTFREYVTVHSATGDGEATVVGSNNHILAYCHIAHNVTLGNHIIMSNVATLARARDRRRPRGYWRAGGRASVLPDWPDGNDWRLLEGGSGHSTVHDR